MNQIKFDKCDVCASKATGVLVHNHQDVPVMFVCRSCDQRTFDAAAQRDVERYMAGENI